MSAIEITLIRSLAGMRKRVKATAKSIGLWKIGSKTVQPDNGATKGKVEQLSNVVSVKPV